MKTSLCYWPVSDLTAIADQLRLHLCLFSHLEGIVNLDAEVAYRALKLRMTQKQLDCPKVLGAPVD